MDDNTNIDIVAGRNVVREAIRSGREIDAILVQKNAGDGSIREIISLAHTRGLVVKPVPRAKLDELAVDRMGNPLNHQGILARVSSVIYRDIEAGFELAEHRGQKPFFIMLDGVDNPHNVGAILRSAEVLGAHALILTKRRGALITSAVCKVASGAQEYLPIVKVTNLSQTIEKLKERGMFVVCADMKGEDVARANMTGAICLVIGSEGAGASRIVKEKSDVIVRVPQLGRVNSLNASCAAAVIMYEKLRQDTLKNTSGESI